MRVVEFPKVLSEYVLPEALQIGVGRPLDKTRAGRMTLLSLSPAYGIPETLTIEMHSVHPTNRVILSL